MGRVALLGVVISHYFKNYYRSKSFYLMFILILLVSSLMTYFSFRYSNNVPLFLGGQNYNQLPLELRERIFSFIWAVVLINIPVFSSVFFGSPSVSSEIEQRTAYHIFPLPIGRYTLLLGKFLAALSVTILISSVYLVFQVASFAYIFGDPPLLQFYYSYLLLLLFIVAIMSFTFMISSIFNRNLYAYITVFVIYYLVFYSLNIVTQLLYSYDPFFLLNNAATIIERVYVNIDPSSFITGGSMASAPISEIILSGLVMLIYIVVSLVAAFLLFERKEAS